MKKIKLFLILFTATLNSIAQTPGSLDLTFGGIGYVTTDYSGSDDYGNSIATQTNGKIIVVGESGNNIALARYYSNGTLDATFGTGGKVLTTIGICSALAYSVKIQPNGKIVVAGGVTNSALNSWNFVILRYDTTGVLDNTFGVGGKVITSVSIGSLAYSLLIQQDGKIVVCGMAWNGTFQSFTVVRYNSNGTLDNTFGTNGQVITHIGSGNDFAVCMAQQSDGKIVVAGYADNVSTIDIAVVRYDSIGVLDNTFGISGSGIVTTPIGSGEDIANEIAIQSDGKIVLVGWTRIGAYDKFAVVRYDTTGILDLSFGTGSIVTTSIGSLNDGSRGVAIEPNGKIIVAGFTRNSSNINNIAIVNYNNNGTLNNLFGTNGIVITPIGSSHADANTIVLQTDGKVLIAGRNFNGINNDFAVVRYNNDNPANVEEIKYKKVVTNYPNPFSNTTNISYQLQEKSNVNLSVFDITGKKIRTIVTQSQQAGEYNINFDAGNLQSGIYYCRLVAGNRAETNKMIILSEK